MGLSTLVCTCMYVYVCLRVCYLCVHVCCVLVNVGCAYPLEVHRKSSIVFMTVKR